MSKYNQLCRQINKNSAELRFNRHSKMSLVECLLNRKLVGTGFERELAFVFVTVREIRTRCRFVFKGFNEENVEMGG